MLATGGWILVRRTKISQFSNTAFLFSKNYNNYSSCW